MTTQSLLSRRYLLRVSSLATASIAIAGCATSRAASPAEVPARTPDEALARLLDGNQRFARNRATDLNEGESRRIAVSNDQQPFATIFGCVDSRVPPELVFDRGLGDLFVIRTAGHVIDTAVLGSLEFGVAELKIPLLLVLGHERCGAVKATIETVEKHAEAEGDITALVSAIRPAVDAVKNRAGDLLENAIQANVALTVARLQSSPILAEALHAGSLMIVGARYDLDTGLVTILS